MSFRIIQSPFNHIQSFPNYLPLPTILRFSLFPSVSISRNSKKFRFVLHGITSCSIRLDHVTYILNNFPNTFEIIPIYLFMMMQQCHRENWNQFGSGRIRQLGAIRTDLDIKISINLKFTETRLKLFPKFFYSFLLLTIINSCSNWFEYFFRKP